jgi:hypothetical protein
MKKNITRNTVVSLAGTGHGKDLASQILAFVISRSFGVKILCLAQASMLGTGAHGFPSVMGLTVTNVARKRLILKLWEMPVGTEMVAAKNCQN